jgi:hypothetical protein
MSKAQKSHAKVIECADIVEHVRSLKDGSRARKRARAIALSVGLILTVSPFLPDWAQSNSASAAAVATPIGKVITAKGTVGVEHVNAVVVQASIGGSEQVKVGDLVYKGDVILTGADSAVGIVFSDGTAFNLSSNARMVLNEFVYDPKGTSNSTLFSLSKGTFTFIAGKVAKTGDMKIDTPVATMGIRGTTPHVEIREDGTVAFSTLIEDKKAIEKIAAPAAPAKKQRQAKNAVSPSMPSSSGPATSPVPQNKRLDSKPERKLDSSFDINVKICRGC